MLEKYDDDNELKACVYKSLTGMLEFQSTHPEENQYEIIWLIYFIKSVLRKQISHRNNYSNDLVRTVATENREFFRAFSDAKFFNMPTLPVSRNHLLQHLAIFWAKQADEAINGPE
ncbi:MAG: hypothetical protein MUQ00_05820 [Candidatus Aminicenantes bacterium]|nr:hypothetical protein [Candidatus Aminicenantes bacterium]